MIKHPFLKVVVFFCLIGFSFSFAFCSEQKVKIIKKDAELKTLPQVESLTIVGLPLGAEFSIAERISEEWIKISLPPNKDGIVKSGYVQVSFIQIIDVAGYRTDGKDVKLAQENALKEIIPNVSSDSKFFDWQREYSAAKSRKSLWTGVAIVGGATLLGGAIVYFVTLNNPINASSLEEVGKAMGLIILQSAGVIVGGLGFIIGIIGESAAARHVRTLESEGKTKGYLKIQAGILPKYRSVGVQLSVGF
jgi:hypothetical protein